jgi:hypothetical protein
LPGDDLSQRWKSKPGKRRPKTFARACDRLQRATRRTENWHRLLQRRRRHFFCGKLHIRSIRLRDGG